MCDDVICDEAKRTSVVCPVEPDYADVEPIDPPGRVLVRLQHEEVLVLVVKRDDGKFAVWWYDCEKEETFDLLSVAVARVAALVRCTEHDWQSSFSDTPEPFAAKAEAFLGTAVS